MRRFFTTNIRIIFVLLTVLVLGSFFRFYKYYERVNWIGDVGRDLLVSRHIWKYGEHISFGHYASGLYNISDTCDVRHYPNFYYYYLSFLWSITQNFKAVIGVSVFLHSLSLLCCYWIGYRMHGKFTGVLFVLFVAVNSTLVAQSSMIIGLQVSIPFCLLAVSLVVESFHRKNRWLNYLGLFAMVFLSSFHYSALVLFSFFFFCSELYFGDKWSLKRVLQSGGRGVAFIGIFMLMHVQIINGCGLETFLGAFFHGTPRELPPLTSGLQILGAHILRTFVLWSPLCFFLVTCCIAFASVFSKKFPYLLFVACGLFVFFLFFGASGGSADVGMKIIQTLYAQYVLICLSCLACGYSLQIAVEKKWDWAFVVVCVIAALFIASSMNNAIFISTHYISRIDETKRLAQDYLKKFGTEPVPTVVRKRNEAYETVLLAYWLEELSGKKLYVLYNFLANYQPIDPSPQKRIFVVDERFCRSADCENERAFFVKENPDYFPTGEIHTFERSILEVFEKKHEE